MTPPAGLRAVCDGMRAADHARRLTGAWLEALGLGPRSTPARVLHAAPLFDLLAFAAPHAPGPALLLVPAPIKRAYIWDLAPAVSVVRRALERAFRVYLLRWAEPGPRVAPAGLAEYTAGALGAAVAAVARDGPRGAALGLVGHSLGGTLATILTALHPDRVAALVLVEAPLCFAGAGGGALGPVLAALRLDALACRAGAIPGTALDWVAASAAPELFVWARWADRFASAADPAAWLLHHRVERWLLDEVALSGRLLADVVEQLYRTDALRRGTLTIGGRRIGPDRVPVPVLAVVDPVSRLVPPAAVLPFLAAARTRDTALLAHPAEVGTALPHVTALVGRRAHQALWPQILDWLEARLARPARRPTGARARAA